MLICGWDCANKTLSWCVLEIDFGLWRAGRDARDRLRLAGIDDAAILRMDHIAIPSQTWDDLLTVYRSAEWCRLAPRGASPVPPIGVVDLHPGEVTPKSDVVKAQRLRTWLESAFPNGTYNGVPIHSAVEMQARGGPQANTGSFAIQSQLIFYFSQSVQTVSPALKQKVTISPAIEKPPKWTYNTRKAFAVACLARFFPPGDIAHIPKRVLDDAGDAFLTAYVVAVAAVIAD